MNVVHLPLNWASVLYHQVNALELQGAASRVFLDYVKFAHVRDDFYILSREYPRLHGRRGVYKPLHAIFLAKVLASLPWCDVVHWYAGHPLLHLPLDLKLVSFSGKKRVVQWQGSELRDPAIEADVSPWYARALDDMGLTASDVRRLGQRSRDVQKLFLDNGFVPLVPVDLLHHVISEAAESVRVIRLGLDTHSLLMLGGASGARSHDRGRRSVVIGHAPSAKAIKGTRYIEEAIHALQKHYSVELRLIHGVSHKKALEMISGCDLFIDNLLQGMYCMTSLEAMAMGIPTISHVTTQIRSHLPQRFPVIEAVPDTVYDVLESMLSDRSQWEEIGNAAQSYVSEYHSYKAIGNNLYGIYDSL